MSQPPKVKPLVWKAAPYEGDIRACDHYAVFRSGWLYLIKQRSHGVYLYAGPDHAAGTEYPKEGSGSCGPTFPTLEAAQAAAQTEWETFILGALEPSALPDTDRFHGSSPWERGETLS